MRRGAVILVAALLAGCGSGDDEPSVRAVVPDPEHARAVARDPYRVTCGDLAAQPTNAASQRLVIAAEFALAEVPELRSTVARITRNRTGRSVYYAMTEICEGRDEAFRPGPLAVQGVRDGTYRAAKNRPG